jgi:uncharacterized iron-regulated membrane protein
MKRLRQLHRLVGLVGAGFLVLAAVTGLLWAYAPHLYWQPGYLDRKHALPAPAIGDAVVDVQAAVALARTASAAGSEVVSVTLRADFGHLLWDVRLRSGKVERPFLVDAVSGAPLTPLTRALAEVAARQYAGGGPAIAAIVYSPRYQPRKGAERPAFEVAFRGNDQLEVVIDAESGGVLEESDRARRFHFLVMRLHQLTFFGFKKELTIVPGAILLVLLGTGVALAPWWRRRARARRDRVAAI